VEQSYFFCNMLQSGEMRMHKANYEVIAETILNSRQGGTRCREVIKCLCTEFKKDNKLFNEQKFISACGGGAI
jgi:hypothetical protein